MFKINRLIGRHSLLGENLSGLTIVHFERAVGARINGDRHFLHELLPLFPVLQAGEIITAHEPNKMHLRMAGFQLAHRVDGILRAKAGFNI